MLTVAVAGLVEGVKLVDVTQNVLVCEWALIVAVPVIEDGVTEVEEAWVVTGPVGETIFVAIVVSEGCWDILVFDGEGEMLL